MGVDKKWGKKLPGTRRGVRGAFFAPSKTREEKRNGTKQIRKGEL